MREDTNCSGRPKKRRVLGSAIGVLLASATLGATVPSGPASATPPPPMPPKPCYYDTSVGGANGEKLQCRQDKGDGTFVHTGSHLDYDYDHISVQNPTIGGTALIALSSGVDYNEAGDLVV
ncbi:MAG: hypothetical protein JWM05_2601, partial [Acidimicrobiales bacterium]|nr:hypothetical protein [Acidimicrobiales bacterium]